MTPTRSSSATARRGSPARSWTPVRTCASSASSRATGSPAGSTSRPRGSVASGRSTRRTARRTASSEWALALMLIGLRNAGDAVPPTSSTGRPSSTGSRDDPRLPPRRADRQDRRSDRLRDHRAAPAGAPRAVPHDDLRLRPVRAARARRRLRRHVHDRSTTSSRCRTWSSASRPITPATRGMLGAREFDLHARRGGLRQRLAGCDRPDRCPHRQAARGHDRRVPSTSSTPSRSPMDSPIRDLPQRLPDAAHRRGDRGDPVRATSGSWSTSWSGSSPGTRRATTCCRGPSRTGRAAPPSRT